MAELFDLQNILDRASGLGLSEDSPLGGPRNPRNIPIEQPEPRSMGLLEILARGDPNFQAVQLQREQTEAARRQREIQDYESRLSAAANVAIRASSMDEKQREKFFETELPELEKVFPGSSDQVRSMAKDKANLLPVIQRFSDDPKVAKVMQVLGEFDPTGQSTLEFAQRLLLTESQARARNSTRKETLSDRIKILAQLMASGKATREDRREYELLIRANALNRLRESIIGPMLEDETLETPEPRSPQSPDKKPEAKVDFPESESRQRVIAIIKKLQADNVDREVIAKQLRQAGHNPDDFKEELK